MASGDLDDYELEKIRAEIQQEKQMKEMLEQSARELRITVEELEKRYDSIENEAERKKLLAKLDQLVIQESNEWKTRFETQEEMNQQLERQIIMLQDKVEEAKRNLKDAEEERRAKAKVNKTSAVVDGKGESPGTDRPKSRSTGITINISVSPQGTPRCTVDTKGQGHAVFGDDSAGKTPRDMKSFDDLSDASPAMVKSMEREKQVLFNQLRDLEWKLDHESKAYHKANDERKQYVVEINSAKNNIEGNKARQRAAVTLQQHEVEEISRSPRLMGYQERHRQRVERKNSKNMPRSDRTTDSSGQVSYNSPVINDFSYQERHRQRVERKNSKNTPRSDRTTDSSGQVSYNSPVINDISNIPEDQRILDPRRGPIKKTAAVKTLPSLDTT